MARINDHYRKLAAGYLFPEISRRVAGFLERNPAAEPIRLGIGDVVLPLVPSVREAMHRAVDELGTEGVTGRARIAEKCFRRLAVEFEYRPNQPTNVLTVHPRLYPVTSSRSRARWNLPLLSH